ncbi:SBBP repeat-containing protein [uncultured Lamprocystis sp.]|uniref:SBBP repeat-containing protein n=1 Tax=uncultured Lamprocystis sp. TaxID=543132 RepID=UPI0025D05CD0|nr:SBBP repeat-containing protein [uncultured Lamprocystis sp.]
MLSLHTSQPNPASRPRPGARPESVPAPTLAAAPEPTAATTPPAVLRLSLVGANPEPVIRGEAALPGKVNYLRGKDPAAWRTGLSTYAKVRYEGVYPGVDLVYYGTQGQLEYDLVLAPGADPKIIRLAFAGADQMRLDDTGNLVLTLGEQQVIQQIPRVYQESNGERTLVPTRYVLADNRQVSLAIGDYDAGRALVIDPVLSYSTYLGGAGYDHGRDIAVDGAGNAYLTGLTESTDFPTHHALQPDYGGYAGDAFVAKLSADGATLVFATYLGGSYADWGNGIAVDGAGNVYVTGQTFSPNFPIRHGLQPGKSGSVDAFVAKISADGASLVYASYLGGSSADYGMSIAADGAGNAYVTGITFSTDFPSHGALQPDHGGGPDGGAIDAFVAKFSADGARLHYATYLGGSNSDTVMSIAVDGTGNAYLTGYTSSTDFPTRHALQSDFGGGIYDTFVAKLSADGATLVYASYLGGSSIDQGFGIAVDSAGNVYLTGVSASGDFPIRDALPPEYIGGDYDAFVVKLSADGATPIYASYFGGSGWDGGADIAVDGAGNAYVTGNTNSTDFSTPYAPQLDFGGGYDDGFVAKLSADGSALVFASYLGGSGEDWGTGIAVDGAGNAYMTGVTSSTDFPTRQALQPDFGGGDHESFVAKIADTPTTPMAALPWLASVGDLTGDGTQHLAVLFADATAGTVTAQIKQAVTGTPIQTFVFDQGYTPFDLAVVPDQNTNGAPELALLGRHAVNGSVQVELRDTLTGERLSAVAFNLAFVPQRLAVLPDRNGNGAAELAVLGINASTGAIAAEIKDARSGAGLGQVFFAKTFRPVDFAAVADANSNGAAELAVLGVNAAGLPRVELRDSASAALVKVLWSPQWTTPLNLAEVPDANNNGTPEVAVLGQSRGGAVLVKTADAGTAVQLGFVYYNRTFTPYQVAALPDLNANGVAELAVLSRDAAGQLKTELRDAVTGALVRNLWFDQLVPLDLAVLPDMNGNGSPEVAVLGVSAADGAQVLIKDTATQAEVSRLDF